MADYIYIPFPHRVFDQLVVDWNKGRSSKGKVAHIVKKPRGSIKSKFPSSMAGSLIAPNAHNKLYVMAHGATAGSRRIGGEDDSTFTAAELAADLEGEGLTKNFVDLRCWVCGSGLGPIVPDPQSQSSFQIEPFAQTLADELYDRGYTNIQVTGYFGEVYSAYYDSNRTFGDGLDAGDSDVVQGSHRSVKLGINGPEHHKLVRASDAKQVFHPKRTRRRAG